MVKDVRTSELLGMQKRAPRKNLPIGWGYLFPHLADSLLFGRGDIFSNTYSNPKQLFLYSLAIWCEKIPDFCNLG